MSVRTTADEKLDAAKEKLDECIFALSEVIDTRTWGHENYSIDFIQQLEDMLIILRRQSRILK